MTGATSGLFCAIAQFTDTRGRPLTGEGWRAILTDQDHILDDKLGEMPLNEQGCARFLISVADIKSLDSPDERTPDLYFTLTYEGREVFRSEVVKNVNFELLDPVSGDADGITQSFGPFLVDITD